MDHLKCSSIYIIFSNSDTFERGSAIVMTFPWLLPYWKTSLQLMFSASRTVASERMWISIWNYWPWDWSHSQIPEAATRMLFSCRSKVNVKYCPFSCCCLPFQSDSTFSIGTPLGSGGLCEEPWAVVCVPYVAFRRHIMHLGRASSSAWIIQTWWTINLSLWIWICWYSSLPGNSLRNIKCSLFEVGPNYFFRREKKKYYVS